MARPAVVPRSLGHEILTLREVAVLLRVGQKTAYTLAQEHELPGFKVRGQWRFRRRDVDSWIATRISNGDHRPATANGPGKTRGGR